MGGKEGRRVVWVILQRAWSVLLRNLDFIPLPLKVIPLKVLEKRNHLLSSLTSVILVTVKKGIECL